MLKKYILLALTLGIMVGCSTEQQAPDSSISGTKVSQATASSSGSAVASEMPEFHLVFFLDPNGRPCIMQNNVLVEMEDELKGKVNVRYVQTTVDNDRNLFYHYGIRALPTILLADSAGKEIKRMSPGVKNAADIRALIQSANTANKS